MAGSTSVHLQGHKRGREERRGEERRRKRMRNATDDDTHRVVVCVGAEREKDSRSER